MTSNLTFNLTPKKSKQSAKRYISYDESCCCGGMGGGVREVREWDGSVSERRDVPIVFPVEWDHGRSERAG